MVKSKRRQPARLLGGGALLLGVAGAHAAMNGKPVRSDNRILRGSRIEQKQSSPLREGTPSADSTHRNEWGMDAVPVNRGVKRDRKALGIHRKERVTDASYDFSSNEVMYQPRLSNFSEEATQVRNPSPKDVSSVEGPVSHNTSEDGAQVHHPSPNDFSEAANYSDELVNGLLRTKCNLASPDSEGAPHVSSGTSKANVRGKFHLATSVVYSYEMDLVSSEEVPASPQTYLEVLAATERKIHRTAVISALDCQINKAPIPLARVVEITSDPQDQISLSSGCGILSSPTTCVLVRGEMTLTLEIDVDTLESGKSKVARISDEEDKIEARVLQNVGNFMNAGHYDKRLDSDRVAKMKMVKKGLMDQAKLVDTEVVDWSQKEDSLRAPKEESHPIVGVSRAAEPPEPDTVTFPSLRKESSGSGPNHTMRYIIIGVGAFTVLAVFQLIAMNRQSRQRHAMNLRASEREAGNAKRGVPRREQKPRPSKKVQRTGRHNSVPRREQRPRPSKKSQRIVRGHSAPRQEQRPQPSQKSNRIIRGHSAPRQERTPLPSEKVQRTVRQHSTPRQERTPRPSEKVQRTVRDNCAPRPPPQPPPPPPTREQRPRRSQRRDSRRYKMPVDPRVFEDVDVKLDR